MARSRQSGGNSSGGVFEASNGNRQVRCRVEPHRDTARKRSGLRASARPLLTACAFRGRRRRGRRASVHRRSAPRARGVAPLGARHAHGRQFTDRCLSRRRDPAVQRHRQAAANDCCGARTRRSRPFAATISLIGGRRDCGGVAILEPRAWLAAFDPRQRRHFARAVPAARPPAHRGADLATPA